MKIIIHLLFYSDIIHIRYVPAVDPYVLERKDQLWPIDCFAI